jgi:hypothetical protein
MDGEREETGDRQPPFAKARPLEPGHRSCFSQTALHYPYPVELIGHRAGRRMHPSLYQNRRAPPTEILEKFAGWQGSLVNMGSRVTFIALVVLPIGRSIILPPACGARV